MNQNEKIDKIFNPRSVAIVGASQGFAKWGFTFLRHLIRGGYKGEIYPINPSGGEFQGCKVYPSLADAPGPIDLAFIMIPPDKVAGALTECGRNRVPAAVVITAGFKEIGEAGKALEEQIAKAASEAGIAMVGPNCAGITSPEPMSMYCMMTPHIAPRGAIAIVSQSGNLAGSIQHLAWKQDIGVSRVVSVGNQALLTAEDFLEYLIDDEKTRVVVAYLEGVADGQRFIDVTRRLTRVKPLIVIKGGNTETGGQAAKSHTGAIAGSSSVFRAACERNGIILVDELEDMLDTAVAMLSQPLPAGNRVGIVSNGGGWGVITADACIAEGLEVTELPEETLAALDQRLPPWWPRRNPIDTVAVLSRGAYFKCAEALAKCPVVDNIIAVGFGYSHGIAADWATMPEEHAPMVTQIIEDQLRSEMRGANFLIDLPKQHNKPVLLVSEYIVGADRDQNLAILELRRKNAPVYPSARRAAQVLSRMVRYRRYLETT